MEGANDGNSSSLVLLPLTWAKLVRNPTDTGFSAGQVSASLLETLASEAAHGVGDRASRPKALPLSPRGAKGPVVEPWDQALRSSRL